MIAKTNKVGLIAWAITRPVAALYQEYKINTLDYTYVCMYIRTYSMTYVFVDHSVSLLQ